MMDLLQSLAGRAAGAVGRMGATLGARPVAAGEGAAAGAGSSVAADFAAALASAMTPGAATAPQGQTGATAGATAGATPGATAGTGVAVEGVEGESGEAAGSRGAATAATAEEPAETVSAEELEAAAAAIGAPVAAPDPKRVETSLALLDPQFEQRLGRVIDRMQSEFGHSVRVTETARSQERQNFLYEQGRTRPGQVVTWTRDSNHLKGRAADVIIDGSYGNPRGYERLAKIAAEEGLRTLGPRDAGHVELPRSAPGTPGFRPALGLEGMLASAGSAEGASSGTSGEAPPVWEPSLEVAGQGRGVRTAPVGGIARVADVARVAEVAQVAQVATVARVATVATPGMVFTGMQQAQSAPPTREAVASRTTEAIQVLHQAMGSHQGMAALRSELASFTGDRERGSGGEGDAAGLAASDLMLGEGAQITRGSFQGAVTEALAVGGTSAAERAMRVMELQDGAATGPVNHVTLRVDNASGGEDRIRVDLRGSVVDATIDIQNAGEAERVSGRLGDLQRSLERHGLEAESLRVRATTVNTAETIDLPRAGLALAEAESSRGAGARSGSGGSDAESFRESWKEESQRQARRDPSDPRERPRRPTPEKETA